MLAGRAPVAIMHLFGHVGGWTVGVSVVVWCVLVWTGIFRTDHLIEDHYGPGGWAP
jgi:hypothetical protein